MTHPRSTRWPQRLVLVGLLLALAGCKEAVYSRLTEAEANDALYALLQGGISAEKRSDPEAGYSIWADHGDMARAIGLLKAAALPEEKHPSLGELFARNQLISTPAEERVRFVYGTEQALAQTLSKIDGVLVARVHIVLPANDPLAKDLKPSSASVFIKHRPGEDLAPAVPAIKDLVVRGIEGLSVDRVAVTLFAAGGTRAPAAAPGAGSPMEAASLVGGAGRFVGAVVPANGAFGVALRLALPVALLAALAWWFWRSSGRPMPRPSLGRTAGARPGTGGSAGGHSRLGSGQGPAPTKVPHA